LNKEATIFHLGDDCETCSHPNERTYGYLRTMCWAESLGTQRKWQKKKENCIIRALIIYNLYL